MANLDEHQMTGQTPRKLDCLKTGLMPFVRSSR